ncbi:YgjV family protein [Salinimonas sp. HHU 13199]|uniref:YgjV family protein n=1 Tax=Salinimonas profundi TaxID=2729140 RepID=A0ABR8LRA6_9ALTE|nr:YgjV family protein [Salinimonas profundi]MBD3586962.1 YgjV family protein [Salinimonas profundi]
MESVTTVIAEGFGALAVIFNFIGYRQNEVNHYRAISAVALLCVSIHFFMLDAMAAGVGCLIASIRNIVALKYRSTFILYLFVALNIIFLLIEWFVLEHDAVIFIAYTSSLIFTVGSIVIEDVKRIRQWFLLAETLGLIYAVLVGSVFGTIFNLSNLTSIVLKLYREDK